MCAASSEMRTEEPPFTRMSAQPAPTSAATPTPEKFRTWLMDLAGNMCSTTHLQKRPEKTQKNSNILRIHKTPGHDNLIDGATNIGRQLL
jgi:hypothetical protein